MRIWVCFISAFVALLAVPQQSVAHGTERHYGNSLDERPVARASPALSIMVIEASLCGCIKGSWHECLTA